MINFWLSIYYASIYTAGVIMRSYTA